MYNFHIDINLKIYYGLYFVDGAGEGVVYYTRFAHSEPFIFIKFSDRSRQTLYKIK